jgi:hypothetical protein
MFKSMLWFFLFAALVFLTASSSATTPLKDGPPGPIAPSSEPGWDFQAPAAREAKATFDAARRKAEADFASALSTTRKALVEDLEAVMKEATRAGDLDEALKLRAALESLRKEETAASRRREGSACLPVGRWSVDFTNGVSEACEIRKEGTASVVEPQRTSGGRVEARDNSVLIVYDDDRLERWTPAGNGMIVEHWFPIARFPSASPVLGFARRTP